MVCYDHVEAFVTPLMELPCQASVRFVLEVPNYAEDVELHKCHAGKYVIFAEETAYHDEDEASKHNVWEVEEPSSLVMRDEFV